MELSRNSPRASALPGLPDCGVTERGGEIALAIQKESVRNQLRREKDPDTFLRESFQAILGKEVERLKTFVERVEQTAAAERTIQLQVQVYTTIVQSAEEFVVSLPTQEAKTRFARDAREWEHVTREQFEKTYAEGSYLQARVWEKQQDFDAWVADTDTQSNTARTYITNYDTALEEMLVKVDNEVKHRARWAQTALDRKRSRDEGGETSNSHRSGDPSNSHCTGGPSNSHRTGETNSSRRTGESWDKSQRRSRETEKRAEKRHQQPNHAAAARARYKRRTHSRSSSPPRRREYHSNRTDNIAAMHDPKLSMPDRARAANAVYEAIPKETRKDAMVSLPKISLKTEHAVQNFV